MKKILLAAVVSVFALSSPAFAATKKAAPVAPPSLIRCAVWIIPVAGCTPTERFIGGAILTAGIGTGVGSIFAAVGLGAAIGAGVGATGALVVQ